MFAIASALILPLSFETDPDRSTADRKSQIAGWCGERER